ncbi:MAG: Ku protein [Betaproteobacteria bacterium]
MARALWTGAINFGLVNVPVELYPAEDKKSFKFSMLDKRDLSPVGYKRYSKASGKEVQWDDIVKGYEFEKDQYVVLSDEDFRRANVKASQTIDIMAFVDKDEIHPEYFETPYYLAPGKKGEKVYALLRETLKSTHRIAVAQVVIRTTQHLAAVLPNGRALMMVTLRYQDELRPATGLELPAESLKSAGVTPKEVELAKRLIDDMTEAWDPSAYKDTYHDDLMGRIHEKIKKGQTQEITKPDADGEESPRTAKIIDLAELLKQSLGKGKAAPAKKPAGQSEAQPPAPRGKTALRVVESTGTPAKKALRVVETARAPAKKAAKASRQAAKRKRA